MIRLSLTSAHYLHIIKTVRAACTLSLLPKCFAICRLHHVSFIAKLLKVYQTNCFSNKLQRSSSRRRSIHCLVASS